MDGSVLTAACLALPPFAFAISWANASRGTPCALDIELAVLDDVREGIEVELPTDDPEREVVTEALPFTAVCGIPCS